MKRSATRSVKSVRRGEEGSVSRACGEDCPECEECKEKCEEYTERCVVCEKCKECAECEECEEMSIGQSPFKWPKPIRAYGSTVEGEGQCEPVKRSTAATLEKGSFLNCSTHNTPSCNMMGWAGWGGQVGVGWGRMRWGEMERGRSHALT